MFGRKEQIEDNIFTAPARDRPAILRGHPSEAKSIAVCRTKAAEAVCSVILRPQVLVRESNSRSPAFQSNVPPHELVLPPPDKPGREDLFFQDKFQKLVFPKEHPIGIKISSVCKLVEARRKQNLSEC